jgi:hypothetical protein
MVQIHIGGQYPYPRAEERKKEGPVEKVTMVLREQPKDVNTEAPQTSRTFSEALKYLTQANYALLSGARMHNPDEDRIFIFSNANFLLLDLNASDMLRFLHAYTRIREIYEWSPYKANGGWTGKFTSDGGQLLSDLLGLPLTITDPYKVYEPQGVD